MLSIHVQGHINRHRIVRQQKKIQWVCPNGHGPNAYYWLTCPVCGQPRPEEYEKE